MVLYTDGQHEGEKDTAMQPLIGKGQLQWNRGGWFGSQIGSSAYMILLGAVMLFIDAKPASIILACGLVPNVVGCALWRHRDRLSPLAGLQWLLLTLFVFTGLAVGTALFFQEATGEGACFIGIKKVAWIPLFFPLTMLMFYVTDKWGGPPLMTQAAGPAQGLAAFGSADAPLDPGIAAQPDGSWRIESPGRQTFRLFEIPVQGIEQCLLTYRAEFKTQEAKGRVCLEMLCRLPGLGEFFSRDVAHAVKGTTDWTAHETPFYLKSGQRPDLVKLNLVMKGRGTVWLRNIPLLQTPLQPPPS